MYNLSYNKLPVHIQGLFQKQDCVYKTYLNFTYNDSGFVLDPDTQPCPQFSMSDVASIFTTTFYALVFLLALPGNLCVSVVIANTKQALPPSDLYLLHLALADLLLAATLPFWATSVTLGWVFGDAVCKAVTVFQELSFYSSILFLTCISVDRYLVIVRAMEARRMNRKCLSWAVCVGVWLLGAFLSLPGLFSSAYASQNSSQIVCHERFDPTNADSWRLATRILRHTLGFLVPLGVMLVCYGVTIRRLLRIRGGFQKQRAMRVIVCVVVGFLLCWTPYHVAVMADTFFRTKLVPYRCPARLAVDRAMLGTHSLGLLHSCVNPVLYAFVGEKFRRRFMQILRKVGIVRNKAVSRSSRTSVSSEITSAFM
uniref:Chemokine (C-X-C motif) receptor 1 n=1 Tax=Neogobius melanostomus TaxID=47308 RepID=A0A8C6SKK9_9GOBI